MPGVLEDWKAASAAQMKWVGGQVGGVVWEAVREVTEAREDHEITPAFRFVSATAE